MHSLGGVDESLKEQLLENYNTADISEVDKKILRYTEKLVKEPATITKTEINNLFDAGFTESGVHDIAQVVAYFSYVNRLADGLGIELEEE